MAAQRTWWVVVSQDCRGVYRNILCSTRGIAETLKQQEIDRAPHGWYADIHVEQREGINLLDVIGT